MLNKTFALFRNKTTLALLVLTLVIGGFSAQATGLLNLTSSGYLVCVHPKTSVVIHPSSSKCPKRYEKLVIGEQGDAGTVGLNGAAGLSGGDGKNGIDGKNGSDGKTLWSGTTDPVSTLGAPGDIFINAATRVLFGPKDLTTGWPEGVSILGRQGVKGETGSQGATGPAGSGGANGSNGAAGSNGSNGAVGDNGSNGTAGSNAILTCAKGGVCSLGSTGPGGGKVFYISTTPNTAATPWRYLEAAPNTWSGGVADPTIAWCSNTLTHTKLLTTGVAPANRFDPSTGNAIGTGFRNTKMMQGDCTFGAANMAAAYNGGGKSDWFLPSISELDTLKNQKAEVGGFVSDNYLSSSGYDSGQAWRVDFNSGNQGGMNKGTPTYVRPIRAF